MHGATHVRRRGSVSQPVVVSRFNQATFDAQNAPIHQRTTVVSWKTAHSFVVDTLSGQEVLFRAPTTPPLPLPSFHELVELGTLINFIW